MVDSSAKGPGLVYWVIAKLPQVGDGRHPSVHTIERLGPFESRSLTLWRANRSQPLSHAAGARLEVVCDSAEAGVGARIECLPPAALRIDTNRSVRRRPAKGPVRRGRQESKTVLPSIEFSAVIARAGEFGLEPDHGQNHSGRQVVRRTTLQGTCPRKHDRQAYVPRHRSSQGA